MGATTTALQALHSPRILSALIFALVFLGSGFLFSLYRLQGADVAIWTWPLDKSSPSSPTSPIGHDASIAPSTAGGTTAASPPLDKIVFQQTIQYFEDFEFHAPFRDTFGDQGARARIVRDWLIASEQSTDPRAKAVLDEAIEAATQALFPFMRNPPRNPNSPTPFADLRSRYERGSAGIVITAGGGVVRYAAHLIITLRSVLRSTLPIQIFYSGDDDLFPSQRAWLSDLAAYGPELEFVDIDIVFNQSTLAFNTSHGGWAMKPYAILASRFERVVLLDADAVLLQPPETALLQHKAFLRSGALLFHDRLLWKGEFADRHNWWKENIRVPGPQLNRSLVWTEMYAEEGDSGVVVVDKSRADVLMGLMHVAWQNSAPVRDSITYKITYGDKESWWFGLELTGATYEFEKHYGAMLGWEEPDEETNKTKICSFTIAHLDENNQLLWYNGGLLKNKLLEGMQDVYEVPNKWMVDAEWIKGLGKEKYSCMRGGPIHDITEEESSLMSRFINEARRADRALESLD
ncbi:mannosyltransferase putative-domain-containing protein [Apodospora peruviana]|uniref:Mannosyltransferase putative-domain-containing protein n=1 Tax=Apodospora peruviana TaxID=516989 RepID=A0AAE0MHL2_9PEZI|nr:mannosyltransferase putative-domain-containing protein [Apodospora peruviana]